MFCEKFTFPRADGRSEIPFEFTLLPLEGQELFETYHGVYVNVAYSLKADIIRKYLGKNLTKTVEFIVELPVSVVAYLFTFVAKNKNRIQRRSRWRPSNILTSKSFFICSWIWFGRVYNFPRKPRSFQKGETIYNLVECILIARF